MASTAGSADTLDADTMDSSQLYRILDIPKQASQADIKRAYRALALRLHPDKASPFSSLSLALHVSFHSRIQVQKLQLNLNKCLMPTKSCRTHINGRFTIDTANLVSLLRVLPWKLSSIQNMGVCCVLGVFPP